MIRMVAFEQKEQYTMDDLLRIMEILRGENGCPWDREQDHHSIRKNFLEETYEVLEAIDQEDAALLQEELGDVLLQVVFHARMEEEADRFDFQDVVTGICKKLIHRHPHIFADVNAETADQVLTNWDAIKKEEKHQASYTETLEQVPKVLPALMRAEKVQHRAKRAGVDYPSAREVLAVLRETVAKLDQAVEAGTVGQIDEEIGDVIFHCVNIARFFQIDSEKSLTNSTEKFINRFRDLERLAAEQGFELQNADPQPLERLLQRANEKVGIDKH